MQAFFAWHRTPTNALRNAGANPWIAAQIDAGHYANDSEAICDLIRREPERGLEIESIRQALIEGEQSWEPEPFDFAAFKRRKAAQHG